MSASRINARWLEAGSALNGAAQWSRLRHTIETLESRSVRARRKGRNWMRLDLKPVIELPFQPRL
jgi:hypothetical protein